MTFQAHSSTSIEAARDISPSQKRNILGFVESRGTYGVTGREVALAFRIAPGTASRALRELQIDKSIKKSSEKRVHRVNGKDRPSSVWKPSLHVSLEAESKRDKVSEVLTVLAEHKAMNGLSLDAVTLINKLQKILK